MMERLSTHVQDFIMEPENSWIEVLDLNEVVKIEDVSASLDCFFVIRG